jgi:dTDP-4-dehydrorhamnose 3,5-epimerase
VRITPTALPGPVVVELDLLSDERGFFARTFDRAAFVEAGLEPAVEQCNASYNHLAGTLRGMHVQLAPSPEAKLVRCTRGAIHDVVVDVRPGSPTWGQHVAVELTAENRKALYVPPFFAHGYLTLVDATEVTYQVSSAYTPGAERGLRHDDPALGIDWPVPITTVSAKDAAWPLLDDALRSEFDADGSRAAASDAEGGAA